MDLMTRFQCYLIRRQMGHTMKEVRSARKRVEKMAIKMQGLMSSYGTTPEDKKFAEILVENCNRLADVVHSLKPYSCPNLMQVLDDIQEMSQVERALMARQGIRPEDLAAK
ncbi:MAG: hypothetical protein H8K10_19545 [Nitrospira sp.]|nr:hypothetical protein [Nitrospira sp.]